MHSDQQSQEEKCVRPSFRTCARNICVPAAASAILGGGAVLMSAAIRHTSPTFEEFALLTTLDFYIGAAVGATIEIGAACSDLVRHGLKSYRKMADQRAVRSRSSSGPTI